MKETSFFVHILSLIKGQAAWVVLICMLLTLFLYGELTGTRLFNSTSTDNWAPQGAGLHNSINHK